MADKERDDGESRSSTMEMSEEEREKNESEEGPGHKNPGNFANDRERASKAGRQGGQN